MAGAAAGTGEAAQGSARRAYDEGAAAADATGEKAGQPRGAREPRGRTMMGKWGVCLVVFGEQDY